MGAERKLKQTVKVWSEGNMLTDVTVTNSWREFTTYGCDKVYCRHRVRAM